jgi:hypothetical protein
MPPECFYVSLLSMAWPGFLNHEGRPVQCLAIFFVRSVGSSVIPLSCPLVFHLKPYTTVIITISLQDLSQIGSLPCIMDAPLHKPRAVKGQELTNLAEFKKAAHELRLPKAPQHEFRSQTRSVL